VFDVWHGTQTSVLIWSALNFTGLCLENVGAYLANLPTLHKLLNKLSDLWYLRLQSVLCAPIFMMSCISNFYFVSTKETGNLFVEKVFSIKGWPYNMGLVMVVMYCACQSSHVITYKLLQHTNKKHL
jgi:hypothetical protein